MNKLNIISVSIFAISLLVYTAWFFNEDLFSNSVIIVIGMILPIIGLIVAFLGTKSLLKIIGITGNFIVLFWSVIIPLTSIVFWNQP
ncbi:MAG: hypothetical protein ABF649_19765 [Bacillus sp. (in: firmicutes)]